MLGDVLHTAADAGRVHREGACESRELQSRPECEGAAAHRGGRRMVWPGVSAQLRSPYTARGAHAAPALLRERVHTASLSVPGAPASASTDVEADVVAKAPQFLFPNAWWAQRQGWLLASPPQVALVHLLGVRCRWCLASDDTDHGAKWEWWHLSGIFADEGYLRAPLLPRSSPSAGAATTHPPPPLPGLQLNSSRWRAAEAAIADTAAHCSKSGKARLLHVDRPLLVAAPALVRAAEAADDGGRAARVLVRPRRHRMQLRGRRDAAPACTGGHLACPGCNPLSPGCHLACRGCNRQAAAVCVPGAAARGDRGAERPRGRAAHLRLLRPVAAQGGLGPRGRPARGARPSRGR